MRHIMIGLVLVSACGDGDKGGSDGVLDVQFPDGTSPDGEVSTSTSFVTLCDDYSDAACKLDACFYPGSTVSTEDCRQAVREVCEDTLTGPIGTHIDGEIIFNSQAASDCLAHFDVACADVGDTTEDIPVACEDAFQGTLTEGTSCAFDALCKPDLFCKGTGETGGTCTGTCAKRKKVGETCSSDELCERGLLCGGTCVPHHAATGEQCLYNENCPDTDWCKNHVCTTRTAAGQPCTNFDCVIGKTCLDGTCQDFPDTAGDACQNGCAKPLLCVTGTCENQPGEGDPCLGEFGSCGSEFTQRLACDPVSNTCVKWHQLGDTCGGENGFSDCDGGYCNGELGEEGTCVTYKSPGDACEPFTNECGRLGCTEAGVCGKDESPCRGPGSIAPL